MSQQKRSNELYFRDGVRQIDMVLTFTDDPMMREQLEFRINFERNLIKDGLHLELEDKKVRRSLPSTHSRCSKYSFSYRTHRLGISTF